MQHVQDIFKTILVPLSLCHWKPHNLPNDALPLATAGKCSVSVQTTVNTSLCSNPTTRYSTNIRGFHDPDLVKS